MNCPFYGHAGSTNTRTLIPSGGNQCALITEAHAPCRMETAGADPDLEKCQLAGTESAAEFATFTRVMFADTLHYPD